jgi:hypothetical protein
VINCHVGEVSGLGSLTLFVSLADRVAKMSVESAILKLAAPSRPIIRYVATHITRG